MIVPFSPEMYNSVGDHFICSKSKITPGQLSDVIRRSLLKTMNTNMAEYYNVKEPESSSAADRGNDMTAIYRMTRYKQTVRKVKAYFKGYPPFKLGQVMGSRESRWGSDCVSSESQNPNSKYRTYTMAVIQNDSMFNEVCQRNGATYVLFVNAFEMYTRFRTCVDLQNNVFQRDIFLHYTLLDASGKYVDGGVVGTTFQSKTNDIEVIIDKNLGLLCGMIIDIVKKTL